MKIIVNKYIPFPGYVAMAVYGTIFWRKAYEFKLKDDAYKNRVVNHESIHLEQMKDFALPFKWCPKLQVAVGGTIFYILYFLEWIYRLITNPKNAYHSISFEKEAYANQLNLDYIPTRKHFAMWK